MPVSVPLGGCAGVGGMSVALVRLLSPASGRPGCTALLVWTAKARFDRAGPVFPFINELDTQAVVQCALCARGRERGAVSPILYFIVYKQGSER